MERYLRVNLLGPGPRLMKKNNLPGRGLTKVEKHCLRQGILSAWAVSKGSIRLGALLA